MNQDDAEIVNEAVRFSDKQRLPDFSARAAFDRIKVEYRRIEARIAELGQEMETFKSSHAATVAALEKEEDEVDRLRKELRNVFKERDAFQSGAFRLEAEVERLRLALKQIADDDEWWTSEVARGALEGGKE